MRVVSRDDAGLMATGYLSVIDNMVDNQDGKTVHLKATFDNADRRPLAGPSSSMSSSTLSAGPETLS